MVRNNERVVLKLISHYTLQRYGDDLPKKLYSIMNIRIRVNQQII